MALPNHQQLPDSEIALTSHHGPDQEGETVDDTILHRIRDVRDILTAARRSIETTAAPAAIRARFLDCIAQADAELRRLYRYERFGASRQHYDRIIANETNGMRRVCIDLDTDL